jgi:murein DD-endopeptidase MepM/ murein hydrolase activator NlpD
MWYDGHKGYDYAVKEWTPVYAAARGKLVEIIPKDGQITLDHSNYGYAYRTIYMHMKLVYGPMPSVVPKGFLLGWVSNVYPQKIGVHLHFGVQKKIGKEWKPADPYGERLWK